MKLQRTVTSISIHPPGESPVYGERVLRVELADEGGGQFIVVTTGDGASVRLDPEEIDALRGVAHALIDGAKDNVE